MKIGRPALLVLSASLIPVIMLIGVMGWFFIGEQQDALDGNIRDRAGIMAAALERELKTQVQLLSLVADSPRMDLPVSRSSFAETARRLQERVPGWEQIRITNREGQVVLSLPPLKGSSDKSVVDRESHDQVIRTGAAAIGNVVIGPQGRAAFAVKVPIERGNRLRAVLSAVIRPQAMTGILYASGLPDNWPAWIVDGQDRLVASTGGAEIAGLASTEFASFGTDGTGSLKDRTGLRVAQASLSDTPWRVRIGLPIADYERPARQATLLLLGAGLCALLLSGSAGFLLQRELRARNRERESLANWQRMDALGKLTGQAAHDFNNLLMVFQSGVDGIRRRRNDEERVTRMLAHMSDGVTRGKTITHRLLSFARRSNQGAEHVELDTKLGDMTPLLKQALNDAISVDIKIADDVWPIKVDPVGLEIALINLLTNAREAMDQGGRVTLSARNVPDGAAEDGRLRGPFVALTISDEGRGVATADLHRVFEPFFSTKENGGAGLGLTQVHSFVESSGGAVKAVSISGHGAAFTLLLPKSTEPATVRGETAPRIDLPKVILIVDDTPSSLNSVRMGLEGLGPNVFTATGGRKALEILERHPEIEAVISDIMMPEMSGIELAEEIARVNPGLPTVLMTGYSDRLEAGAQLERPVIMKPFKHEDLAAALTAARSTAPDRSNVVRLDIPTKS